MDHLSHLCKVINQLHEMERKAKKQELSAFDRQFQRIKEEFQEMNVFVENPVGKDYDDRRTDYDANIVGDSMSGLKIVDVLKPIVYHREGQHNTLVQRGVVIVEAS